MAKEKDVGAKKIELHKVFNPYYQGQ